MGGINGGLVYFEPPAREFRSRDDYLCSGRWNAVTDMAEQEFLSHWFGRDGRWYALPPEFNFQLHPVFLSGHWWPPSGQQRPSKYYQMLSDTTITDTARGFAAVALGIVCGTIGNMRFLLKARVYNNLDFCSFRHFLRFMYTLCAHKS